VCWQSRLLCAPPPPADIVVNSFDHQMVVDSDAQMLYVFGGKQSAPSDRSPTYSGLFRYDILRAKWTMIL
jgi:hypothetical protein